MVVIKRGIINSYSRKAKRSIGVTKLLAISGSLIILVAALSYYGQHVGSFTISMKNSSSQRGLALCTSPDLLEPTSRLTADPLGSATDCDYSMIPKNIDMTEGTQNGLSKNGVDQTYFAYSFYLFNCGNESIDYVMDFSLVTATRNLDSILRIMIIENYDGARTESVYAKLNEKTGKAENIYGADGKSIIGETIPFESDDKIMSKTIRDFDVGQVIKYTVVMWLDGWDDSQSQDMLGGALRFSLDYYLAPDE